MPCTACFDICNIYKGLSSVNNIGVVDPEYNGESLLAIVTNLGTKRTEFFSVDVDENSNVLLDLVDDFFEDGQSYNIYILEPIYVDGEDTVPIRPHASESAFYECLLFTIKTIC